MTARATHTPLLRALFAGRDHDARLAHVLEQLPAAAFLAMPRTGAFLAINGKAVALTEWTRDDLLARSLSEVVAPPDAADAHQQIHQLEPGETRYLSAVPLRTRSGQSVAADLQVSAFTEAAGGELIVLVLATPADERLAQEREAAQQGRALEALERLLALLAAPTEASLEQAVGLISQMLGADATALYQVPPDQPGMRLFASANAPGAPGLPQVLGPSEGHYLKAPLRWWSSQRPEGYLHQAVRAAGYAALMAHPVGDPPAIVGAVCVAYRPGNAPPMQAVRLLALAAQHLHQLTTLINAEAGHQRTRDLAVRLNGQLAAVTAQVDEGVVLLNVEGTVDELNNAAARMLGYRSEDVTGLPLEDILIGDAALTSVVRAKLESADTSVTRESRLLRRNGEAFPARVRVQPLAAGGCAVVLRDLSDVRANAIQQEHMDQLAYLGQATQAFAHEVRGPLNNIAMGVQFLASRLSGDEAVQAPLSKIQAECTRLSALMNDMLAWAKPLNPQLQPTDLDAMLKRLLNRFSLKMEQRNVRSNYTTDPGGCPPVLADARLLEQVFVNLIDNGLQAMPAGGHLSVSLTSARRGAAGLVVEARVADSGPGITEEARRHIFDPYFTTKPEGTGLGLAICKRLVTLHKGAIGVESYPGTGTIFTVTLPAYEGPADETETP